MSSLVKRGAQQCRSGYHTYGRHVPFADALQDQHAARATMFITRPVGRHAYAQGARIVRERGHGLARIRYVPPGDATVAALLAGMSATASPRPCRWRISSSNSAMSRCRFWLPSNSPLAQPTKAASTWAIPARRVQRARRPDSEFAAGQGAAGALTDTHAVA